MKDKRHKTPFAATSEAVVAEWETDVERGLGTAAVNKRRLEFGPNRIATERKRRPIEIFFSQLKSPIVFLLLFAAGFSFYFQEWMDGGAILAVILINSTIGFWMEFKAELSMESLKKLSLVPARVIRNGETKEMNSEELVPGDIVLLEAGNIVPADGRVLAVSGLEADESAMTGESIPVGKQLEPLTEDMEVADRTNMLFKGTHITKGSGSMVITAIGMETELGEIARMTQTAEQSSTPLEKKLEKLSKVLIFITLGLVVVIFLAGLLSGQKVMDMLRTSIALAVAAIPEGLPIVATVALAQGMLKMARQKVIVKKLSSVETLGSTNVICTDKTGTLTLNKIEVTDIVTPNGEIHIAGEGKGKTNAGNGKEEATAHENTSPGESENISLILQVAVLCNTAEIRGKGKKMKEIGDPMETGLLKFAMDQGQHVAQMRKAFPKVAEEPFSSETKIMATAHADGKEVWVFAKGAAEALIPRCKHKLEAGGEKGFTPAKRQHWLEEAERMAANGRRVIAAAYKKVPSIKTDLTQDFVFLGLIGMIDPPRKNAFKAIQECKSAGIHVIMITGDHPATARNIALELGIATGDDAHVMLGKEMKAYEKLGAKDKKSWVESAVFARVNPRQKMDLIRVLQEKGHVVGMTGDGVNDAPALRKADIGIAMGKNGTQVAQDAADMVLKDDSFSSIVKAIHQGRVIAENIRKFVTYLISTNMSELMAVAIASTFNLGFQLLPLQILFINLITDVLPALALGVTKGSPDTMQQKPRRMDEPIIDGKRWRAIFFYAAILCATSVGAVFLSRFTVHGAEPWNPERNNNILFFSLIAAQLLHVFNMGRPGTHYFKSEVWQNRYVWWALLCSTAIIALAYFLPPLGRVLSIHPLGLMDWLIALGAAVIGMALIQLAQRIGLVKA